MGFLFIISSLFISFAHEKQFPNSTLPVLNIDQATRIDSFKLSTMFDSVQIITLDRSADALIGNIDRIEIVDGYIILLDKNIAKKIFVFNQKGEYIRQIGNSGQGKGEYISSADFTLDRIQKHIFILDRQPKKIHKYSYITGKHLSSINCPKFSTNILYHENAIYTDYPGVHSSQTDYIIRKSSVNNGKEIELLLSPKKHNKGWEFTLSNNDGIFLSRSSAYPKLTHLFMDTVFCIGPDGVSPYFTIQSKEMMNQKDIENLNIDKNPMDLLKLIESKKYYNLQTYIESNDFIFFQLQKGAKPTPVYYDKNKKITLQGTILVEDILFNNLDFKFTQLRFGGEDSNGVFFYLAPEYLSEFDKLKNTGYYPGLDTQTSIEFENKEDMFNGAIFYYKFKNKIIISFTTDADR